MGLCSCKNEYNPAYKPRWNQNIEEQRDDF